MKLNLKCGIRFLGEAAMIEAMTNKVRVAVMIGLVLLIWIIWTNPGIASETNNDYIILVPGILIVVFITISCSILLYYMKKKYIVYLLIGCTALTSLVWHKFDLVPYYKGMHYFEQHMAFEYFDKIKSYIKIGGEEDVIKDIIDKIIANNPAEIIIEKNGETFCRKESNRGDEYEIETYFDHEEFQVGEDSYTYTHKYGNQPYFGIAWIRAMTLSVCPDLIMGDVTLKDYMERKLYNRSISFWTLFFIIWMMILLSSVMVFQNKRAKEKALWEAENLRLKERVAKAKLKYERLKTKQLEDLNQQMEMYKLTHLQIFEDFNKGSLLDAKQTLQNFDSRWENIIEHILGDARHDLKNKLTVVGLNDLEKDLYDKAFTPFKDTILENLRNLPKVLDYQLGEFKIQEIIQKSQMGIPKNYLPDGSKMGIEFRISEYVNEDLMEETCFINMDRITSIVNNFITNAGKAVQRRDDQAYKNNEEYSPYVELMYTTVDEGDKMCLVISVQDNGGGFPDEIIDKAYKSPIARANGDGKGQGTMYVAYFAKLMKCELQIKNQETTCGRGACVSIKIPIKEV